MKKFYAILLSFTLSYASKGQISPNALDFDGIDDYVNLSGSGYLPWFQVIDENPFTIEAWIQIDPGNPFGESCIISSRDQTGATLQGFKLAINNGNLAFF